MFGDLWVRVGKAVTTAENEIQLGVVLEPCRGLPTAKRLTGYMYVLNQTTLEGERSDGGRRKAEDATVDC